MSVTNDGQAPCGCVVSHNGECAMTNTAGRTMPPGRELDAAVQDHVINRAPIGSMPRYSTTGNAMLLVIERLVAVGWYVRLERGLDCFVCLLMRESVSGHEEVVANGDTLPHAAALAALKAVEATNA